MQEFTQLYGGSEMILISVQMKSISILSAEREGAKRSDDKLLICRTRKEAVMKKSAESGKYIKWNQRENSIYLEQY